MYIDIYIYMDPIYEKTKYKRKLGNWDIKEEKNR